MRPFPQSEHDAFLTHDPAQRAHILLQMAHQHGRSRFEALRNSTAWSPQPPRHLHGLARAVLFMLVRDNADIIGQNLHHHYALGFRRFFILDHASTDGTAAIIADFRANHPEAGVFYGYDFVTGMYHAEKMEALEALVVPLLQFESPPAEWLFFVDADEFITFATDDARAVALLENTLADPTKLLLIFHWVQCSSRKVIHSLPGAPDIFATFNEIWRRMLVPVTKIAYRLGRGLAPGQGNHMVKAYPGHLFGVRLMADVNCYLFHFPARTVEETRRKLVNAKLALDATDARSDMRPEHWIAYTEWYAQLGDKAIMTIIEGHIEGCTKT